ncbi:alkaline phosphatase [Desulfosarcina alkanivorans]|uniref:Alkaline phosphatase n=1 Tax=Desulfosarcina alkanivorans TaxID=571177 RepID=A0A5K7YNR1_9BACT|nr:alkaline phosphatase [Desulfosarcina alkanivorans]BBO68551.1 alkaline phosphatase [Desulfosarcina alkanivorans]
MKKKMVRFVVLSLVTVMVAAGCSGTLGRGIAPDAAPTKNVIMIIGDGMGPEQVGLLLSYARQAPRTVIKNRKTAFDRLMDDGGVMGLSMTYPSGVLVTDSAASGTQLATGQFAGSEMIGADKDGNPVETILEKTIQTGKSTGLVSDTRLTHATPAAFAAHQPHRSLENEIAVDMLNAGPDVMLSGGLRYWIPKSANDKDSAVRKELEQMTQGSVKIKSKRKDERNLLKEAREKGYDLAFNRSQMEAAQGKVLGLFAYSAMPDGIKVTHSLNSPERTIPTLKEMSAKALELLSKNDKGFFLMIEAGMIDWAAHYNDTGLMLHEMMRLNETVDYVLDWAENRDDTLVIVTADHTTGGFGISYNASDLPQGMTLPGSLFQGREFKPGYNFGNPEVLDKIYSQQLSYGDIFYGKFDSLPKEQQTPAMLAEIVNAYTEFEISEDQAARVLATEENPFFVDGHSYLGTNVVPKMGPTGSFFVYQTDDNRQNLLAREVAADQMVVWNSGTHTATPVLVFAKGAPEAMAPFGDVLHHTQLSRYAIEAITNR